LHVAEQVLLCARIEAKVVQIPDALEDREYQIASATEAVIEYPSPVREFRVVSG